MGRGTVVELPADETERRWKQVTYEWPIVDTRLHGLSRDAFMARHRANHISIAYAPSPEAATKALFTKAAVFDRLGLKVHICGVPTRL